MESTGLVAKSSLLTAGSPGANPWHDVEVRFNPELKNLPPGEACGNRDGAPESSHFLNLLGATVLT